MATVETHTEATPPAETLYDGFISYSHSADDLLAPRLQAGLQRFAKPWWKRRAVRIFRDEASLAANPHLWTSITEALDESGWFVLLCSPEAADSQWVNREIEYWLEHQDRSRIIPVVTDGEFEWGGGDLGAATTAAPPALYGAFADEPRWVDMRFARTEEQLDLNNASFRAATADIASAIRGIPKDELESEEVRQHRRTIRTAWAAALVVFVLAVVAGGAAIFANGQRLEADEQRIAAEENAVEADTQRDRAEAQTAVAQDLEFDARSDALAASAVAQIDTDPELALLLATLALEREPQPAALTATHQALQRHRGVFETSIAAGDLVVPRFATGGMSPDGSQLALVSPGRDLEVWEVGDESPLWTAPPRNEEWMFLGARFAPDGSSVVALQAPVSVIDPFADSSAERQGVLMMLDARTGDEIRSMRFFGCPITLDPEPLPVYPDPLEPIPWVGAAFCGDWRSDVGFLDPDHGSFSQVSEVTAGAANYWSQFGIATTDAGRRYLAVGVGGPGRVFDLESGEVIFEFDGGVSTLSADGGRILARGHGAGRPLELWDLTGPTMLWSFPKTLTRVNFSADEELVYGTSQDGSTYVLDAETGALILGLSGQQGVPIGATMSHDNRWLATHATDRTARVWDLAPLLSEGDIYTTMPQPRSQMAASTDLAAGIVTVWGGVPQREPSPWETSVLDLASGEILRTVTGGASALSPDGTRLAYRSIEEVTVTTDDLKRPGETGVMPRVGPIRIIDIASGDLIHELGVPCEQYLTPAEAVPSVDCHIAGGGVGWDLEWSGDGLFLGMADSYDDLVVLWDATTGEEIYRDDVPGANARAMAFTPDRSQFINLASGGIDYRLGIYNFGATEDTTLAARFSQSVTLPGGTAFAEMVFTPDGSLVAAADNTGGITLIDTATWDLLAPIAAHEGEALDVAINPSGTLIASGGDDAFVRVWNVADRSLVTEIRFDVDEIANVEFIDDNHLLVAAGFGNEAIVITLDPDELLDLARSRLLRGFGTAECTRFGIDPCPTLEEMKRG